MLAQRERYIWSVFPSLAAWPALQMEPAPGSVCIALLLVSGAPPHPTSRGRETGWPDGSCLLIRLLMRQSPTPFVTHLIPSFLCSAGHLLHE
jgi:hypothetical protein